MGRQDDRQTLGEAIKARRVELGWSQEELAHRMNDHGDVTFRQSDVSRLELGKVGLPHRERLARIAAVLDLSLGELLARSGWAGWGERSAAEAITPADAEAPGVSLAMAPQTHVPAEWTAPGDSSHENVRLQEVLAQARRTIERSKQVMKQSEALQAIYEQRLPDRRTQTVRSRTAK